MCLHSEGMGKHAEGPRGGSDLVLPDSAVASAEPMTSLVGREKQAYHTPCTRAAIYQKDFLSSFFLVVIGFELRVSCLPGRCFTLELLRQPKIFFLLMSCTSGHIKGLRSYHSIQQIFVEHSHSARPYMSPKNTKLNNEPPP
jgi:hypothetical protein